MTPEAVKTDGKHTHTQKVKPVAAETPGFRTERLALL